MNKSEIGPSLGVRLPNWVGDVCMALPALHLLIDQGFQLHLCGRGWAAELLAGLGLPVTTMPKGLRRGAATWRQLACRRGLLLTNSLSSAAQARLAGVSALGYRGDGRRLLLGHSLPKPQTANHEVERLFALATACCAWHDLPPRRTVPGPHLQLPLSYHQLTQAANLREQAAINGPYVILAPLAAGTINGQSKQWPHFAQLLAPLRQQGYHLIACPGPGEEAVTEAALPGVHILSKVGLGAYAALCKDARLVVGNDSGPVHLASAVGARSLAIFGRGQPWRTAPWGGAWIGSAEAWPTVDAVLSACEQLLQPSQQLTVES